MRSRRMCFTTVVVDGRTCHGMVYARLNRLARADVPDLGATFEETDA